jgi:CO/xanthine dehydrogenase Mo-binding subunit
MTKFEHSSAFTRRSVLLGGGALVVSVGAAVSLDTLLSLQAAYAQGAKPPLTPDQLSSYIAVNADGTVSAFFGKMDMGHGLHVAIAQIVADELDVPFKSVKVFMGDTANSVNQGGASGSTGIQYGGKQMRIAAAEARRVLVEMASALLSTPVEQLKVNDGVVISGADATKRISYAQMIGGKYSNVQLDWNKQFGNTLYAPGKAQPKKPSEHKIVGQPIKREDVGPKVFAQEDFVTDVRVPGMVHGRMIRPAIAGAVPVKIDESSIKDIPGAKVVWDKGFLGVVADKEWDAIQAAQTLKVEWSQVDSPFPEQRRFTTTFARRACVSAASTRKTETLTTPSRPLRKSSRRSTNGPSSRMPAWVLPAPSSKSRTARSLAGVARRNPTSYRKDLR